MKKSLINALAFSFLLFSISAAHAGIVFSFGKNVTPERQLALQAAAAEIEQILDIRQNVKISLSFKDTLQCGVSSAVLGFAGPQNAFGGFPGAPQADVLYVSAQAADMGYATAMAETVHIAAQFNNKLGSAGCLPTVSWYFGTDHNPGPGQIDFLSTAVHEFMHGLGFLSFIDSSGKLAGGFFDNYSTFLFDNSTGKSWKNMNDSERAASILNDNGLVWNGSKTSAMASLLQNGTTGGKPRLYAPTTYKRGSSTSHFDTSLYYNANADEVMEPYDSFPQQSIMASAAFCDMGWNLLRDIDADTENDCVDAFPLVFNDTDGDGVANALDAFPNDPTETVDTDSDGVGNNADTDDDNDGVLDVADNCPLDKNSNQFDWNNVGVGDACGDDIAMKGVQGLRARDRVGAAVAYAGDFNGDGYGDYVVGIPGYDVLDQTGKKVIRKDAGRAVVVSGKTDEELVSIEGAFAKDAMGFAVAGGGDVNNDQFSDVVVGSPKEDNLADTANKLVDAGSVTVLYGRADPDKNPVLVEKKTFYGDSAKSYFGSALAIGYVDNDNHADIVVGAPKADDVRDLSNKRIDAGSVTVIDGAALIPLPDVYFGSMAKAYAGTSVAVGNFDGLDGADIVVGSPKDDDETSKRTDAGSVTVYFTGAVKQPFKQYGSVPKAYLGKSVATGNVNGVPGDELLIGAPGDDNGVLQDAGSVSVFFDGVGSPLKKYGATAKAGLGNSVTAGDLDGDGKLEIVAGASRDDVVATQDQKKVADAGSVRIWRWQAGSLFPFGNPLYGESYKDYFGSAVSAGNINGDGKADLIIGVPGDNIFTPKNLSDTGTVQLFSGAKLK